MKPGPAQSMGGGDGRSQEDAGIWSLHSHSYLHPYFLAILHMATKSTSRSCGFRLLSAPCSKYSEGQTPESLALFFLPSKIKPAAFPLWKGTAQAEGGPFGGLFLPPCLALSSHPLNFDSHHFPTCFHSQLYKSTSPSRGKAHLFSSFYNPVVPQGRLR